ncbi:hypothetical protein QBA57_28625 [Streptomyces scabiei]|uniref:hypothetical protein n=1 Tax=Streptomyces scabiei TaxID=1930 RepID=UPI001B32B132|nr:MULTISPECIES: hypothetical protein [Streptomyces]MBP5883166.1 hypothetical protein [Streptomyces sp. LBUM 1487]MDX2626806.1 hypothetical protein [Streptomyces scabiei]MDX3162743.1 hypothetical protein [Streptomyces scabiei]
MPGTFAIPIYLRIGSGTETEVGQVVLDIDGDGTVTMTTSDIAAALRATADAMEASAKEVDDAAADV